jgi:hypothetical protein
VQPEVRVPWPGRGRRGGGGLSCAAVGMEKEAWRRRLQPAVPPHLELRPRRCREHNEVLDASAHLGGAPGGGRWARQQGVRAERRAELVAGAGPSNPCSAVRA